MRPLSLIQTAKTSFQPNVEFEYITERYKEQFSDSMITVSINKDRWQYNLSNGGIVSKNFFTNDENKEVSKIKLFELNKGDEKEPLDMKQSSERQDLDNFNQVHKYIPRQDWQIVMGDYLPKTYNELEMQDNEVMLAIREKTKKLLLYFGLSIAVVIWIVNHIASTFRILE
jgi:hypothetical protein